MKRILRYALGVVAGIVVGEVVGVLLAVVIDIIIGAEVTGGRWTFNAPNVALAVCKGLVAGYTAGFIARRRGKLIGAVTVFIPLFAVIAVSIALNADLLGAMADRQDTKPAVWAWIALFPAIVGGHYGADNSGKGFSAIAMGLGGASMLAAYLGSAAFHIYTLIVAYDVAGFGAALLTAATPPLAELYWFVRVWKIAGYVTNQYDILFIILIVLWLLGFSLMGLASHLARQVAHEPRLS